MSDKDSVCEFGHHGGLHLPQQHLLHREGSVPRLQHPGVLHPRHGVPHPRRCPLLRALLADDGENYDVYIEFGRGYIEFCNYHPAVYKNSRGHAPDVRYRAARSPTASGDSDRNRDPPAASTDGARGRAHRDGSLSQKPTARPRSPRTPTSPDDPRMSSLPPGFSLFDSRAVSSSRFEWSRYARRRSVNAARHRRTLRNAAALHAHFALVESRRTV